MQAEQQQNIFQCTECRVAITRSEFRQFRTCRRIACRHQYYRKVRRERIEREKSEAARQEARTAQAIAAANEKLSFSDRQFGVRIVPANTAAIRNLPEKRQRKFRDHLMDQISKAATLAPAEAASAQPTKIPEKPHHLEAKACAVCAGACCTNGGVEAYLAASDLRQFMAARPELRPRHVLAAYLEKLPNKTFDGSCVYHSADGCTLPREMRARICNSFRCAPLQSMREPLPKGVEVVAVVAMRGKNVERLEAVCTQASSNADAPD